MPASKVRGEAPGKLILFGEHAVVYGAPALGMPLSRPAVAELGPGTGQVSLRLAKGLEAEASPHAAQPTDLVARVLGPRMQQLDVRLTLYFPPMSGFGSSAAIVVAILRALEVMDGKPPPPRGASWPAPWTPRRWPTPDPRGSTPRSACGAPPSASSGRASA